MYLWLDAILYGVHNVNIRLVVMQQQQWKDYISVKV